MRGNMLLWIATEYRLSANEDEIRCIATLFGLPESRPIAHTDK
jgi:hypothetical protein